MGRLFPDVVCMGSDVISTAIIVSSTALHGCNLGRTAAGHTRVSVDVMQPAIMYVVCLTGVTTGQQLTA
ncbi:hypothetical protein ACOMHN_016462 [Nucella lapillus]